MGPRIFLCLSVFLVAALARPASLAAETLIVDLVGAGDFKDIQSAIDAPVLGDTLLVKPVDYAVPEPISFEGKKIAVKSEAGAETTRIRMSASPRDPDRSSVVVFENWETEGSALEGLTITGGKGTKYGMESHQVGGGGIYHRKSSSATLANCTISGNSADWPRSAVGGLSG